MFRETFGKFSSLDRGKGNTRHAPRHTTRPTGNEPGRAMPGRAGPKFRELGPGPGPVRQENWNFQARPGPRTARPILSSKSLQHYDCALHGTDGPGIQPESVSSVPNLNTGIFLSCFVHNFLSTSFQKLGVHFKDVMVRI
jgi:hypothetical protein